MIDVSFSVKDCEILFFQFFAFFSLFLIFLYWITFDPIIKLILHNSLCISGNATSFRTFTMFLQTASFGWQHCKCSQCVVLLLMHTEMCIICLLIIVQCQSSGFAAIMQMRGLFPVKKCRLTWEICFILKMIWLAHEKMNSVVDFQLCCFLIWDGSRCYSATLKTNQENCNEEILFLEQILEPCTWFCTASGANLSEGTAGCIRHDSGQLGPPFAPGQAVPDSPWGPWCPGTGTGQIMVDPGRSQQATGQAQEWDAHPHHHQTK